MRIKELRCTLADELDINQLAIIEAAAQTICESVDRAARQNIFTKLENLLLIGDDYNLMSYASLQIIRVKLDIESSVVTTLADDHQTQGRSAKAFNEMGNEFALLLSLLIESSGSSQVEQDKEFERVLKCYTMTQYPRRTSREAGIVAEVVEAFQILYVQPPAIREAFVQHCVEIVHSGGHVARAEKILLYLFATSLESAR